MNVLNKRLRTVGLSYAFLFSYTRKNTRISLGLTTYSIMKKRPKLTLIFDEEKRKEYLTGFRKRKLERKEKGRKASEKLLKEEIKAVKEKYREAARKKLENIQLPGMLDSVENILSTEKHIVGDQDVVIQKLDLCSSHYFMGSCKEQNPNPIIHSEEPYMSLKKALKMNPVRSKKRFRHRKKRHFSKHKRQN
ncbi:Nucleolar protein 12 [Schistosoma japonicum]|nr:Nucleolar protein 12 [Schistosoma japonicum]KAH8861253.1 Nucleolar protein 12 [Schistosoma japonicum]